MSFTESVLRKDETHIAEVPVEHQQQFNKKRIGSIIVSDKRCILLHLNEGSWEIFDEHKLSSEPFAQYRKNELYSVFFPMPDGERISQLKSEYISNVEDITGSSYFMNAFGEMNQEPDIEPDDCRCERISSNKVLVESENSELSESFGEQEFRLVSCKDCHKIYGRYREGRKASFNKLFSADWLLGGDSTSESIVEIGKDEAFAIHHPPHGSTRVQDAVLTASQIPRWSDDVVSTYKHEYQHALCYIQDEEMAGYLTWEDHDKGPILSQLYVRNEHREEGIAATLVSEWSEKVCESDHYFADDLTTGGRAVLESIDHLDTRSGPAQEVYSLIPMAFG
ncbi:hypothetical protein [Natronolimnobius baerhuensis]|uniref:Uncharacterized protein n=1 Tax=Natronolimnobius baerhuensis TaxID=253108 RepID=A0A202EA02_9EURY|nr:hypothetical protein [Natronolimnobius baerhuensis]OVE85106.1 hypothetical protein B2G88_12225 [Natronolimnobius baerhuensis]